MVVSCGKLICRQKKTEHVGKNNRFLCFIQPNFVRRWEKLVKITRQHVEQENISSGYPGPAEARVIMREIEKCRWLVTSNRLLVLVSIITYVLAINSDLVFEAKPWPRGVSRPKFMALTLALRAALSILA